jgi:penicillin-binding protein 2
MKHEGQRTRVFTRRALVMMAAQAGALGLLGAKLYRVQVEQGAKYRTLAENNRISARLLAPTRGIVRDRFGQILAGNTLTWRALLLAEETTDVSGTLDRFAQVVDFPDRDRARVEREMAHSRRFIPIMLRDFLSWDEMAKVEVHAPDLPGVIVDVGTTRHYPFGPDLAHVVGYVAPPSEDDAGDDPVLGLPGMRVGRAGVEKSHEDDLRGDAGQVQMEVNAVGRVIRELDRTDGTPGAEVTLGIDVDLQKAVLQHIGDESASAVVLDCTNGEVLAMATNPSFDPSLFDSGISQAQWIEWTSNRRTPLINKATAGMYPPGSTFKMTVGLAALSAGVMTPSDRIFCPGYIDVGTMRFHCYKKGGHGSLNMRDALKHSCDVFFYDTARRVGIDAIADTANKFGLGTELPIDLPGARSGLIPTAEWRHKHRRHWGVGDTINSGIGQGVIQATPLQLATYAARLATGRAITPHMATRIGNDPVSATNITDYPELDIAPEYLDVARAGMFAVVNEAGGTAPKARLDMPGVQMAGKTGSSQVRHVSRWLRESGHFNSLNLPWEFRPHALFVCFAPFDSPRYAAAVVIEHGNAGADVAAPLARNIMRETLDRDPARRQVAPGQVVAQQGA